MRIIAHRGLLHGPDDKLENKPETIERALKDEAYDVEVDVWYKNNKWYLGHDEPKHRIPFKFIEQSRLWIHAKNIEAMEMLCYHKWLNYFWHQNDDVTLTSSGYLWTYPGKLLTKRSVCVMPEKIFNFNENEWKTKLFQTKCYAICTNYSVMVKDALFRSVLRNNEKGENELETR